MRTRLVTYTIPEDLDILLQSRVGRGKMSRFVTQALWDALKKQEDSLLTEYLEADKDAGNIEAKQNFSAIEGEDFNGIENFDFKE